VKRLSLVRCHPRADRVEYLEGNSRPPLKARWSETAAGSESTARPEKEASRNLRDPAWSWGGVQSSIRVCRTNGYPKDGKRDVGRRTRSEDSERGKAPYKVVRRGRADARRG